MELFADYFRELYDSTGWNFPSLYEQYEYDRFLEDMGVSYKLIVASLAFSLVIGIIGFIGAWAQGHGIPEPSSREIKNRIAHRKSP